MLTVKMAGMNATDVNATSALNATSEEGAVTSLLDCMDWPPGEHTLLQVSRLSHHLYDACRSVPCYGGAVEVGIVP